MENAGTALSFWELLQNFGPKVLFAILCGGIVGFERELKSKPAGIKTNILICLGAALYTSVSIFISKANSTHGYFGDPGRLAAQIVSGIGFLGGGTIIQSRGSIQGLTTAATIWVVAAIGICVGTGQLGLALFSSVTVVTVLVLTGIFEDRILGRSLTFACEVVVDDPEGKVRSAINHALAQNELLLDDFDVSDKGMGLNVMLLKYQGRRSAHKKFILDLWSIPGVKEVSSRG